jgi:hypothetical protein
MPDNSVSNRAETNSIAANDTVQADAVADQTVPDNAVADQAGLNRTTPNRAWVDAFGSAICTIEGGFGGRVALVVTTPELATRALEQLMHLPRFKGRVGLAVMEHVRAAPINHAIRQLGASVVIGLRPMQGVATRGPGVHVESGRFTASTGLEYVESSDYEGWSAGWLADTLAEKLEGQEAPSVVSSLAAVQGLATATCGPDDLEGVLVAALG